MKKVNFEFILVCLAFIAFLTISLYINLTKGLTIFRDEAHAWTIAQNCSITQILELMKTEGHMLVWYLLIMPFAKLKLWYPYSMLIINWIFCAGALLCVLLSKNINNFVKFLLMFCPIFISLYAVSARCYSVGIFFLFLACLLYQKRLKHPYLYFLILFLAANTSLVALIGAFGIGCIFLFDLYKQEFKTKINPAHVISILAILTFILFCIQFSGFLIPNYVEDLKPVFDNVVANFLNLSKYHNFKIGALRILAISSLFLFSKNIKTVCLFLTISILSALFFCFVYIPYTWHLCFFFIYIFVCYWIFIQETTNKKYKLIATILIIMAISYTYISPLDYKKGSPNFYLSIMSDKELQNEKIFTDIPYFDIMRDIPLLSKKDIYVYDLENRKLGSFETLKETYQAENNNTDIKNISKFYDDNKANYLISKHSIEEFSNYKFIEFKSYYNDKYYIYKLLK